MPPTMQIVPSPAPTTSWCGDRKTKLVTPWLNRSFSGPTSWNVFETMLTTRMSPVVVPQKKYLSSGDTWTPWQPPLTFSVITGKSTQRVKTSGGATPKFWGEPNPCLPSSSLRSPYFSSPSFLSLPLEVGLLNTAWVWESAVIPPAESGQNPNGKKIWCIKIWHLVTPVLLIYLGINWPQCMHTGQLLVGPNALCMAHPTKSLGAMEVWVQWPTRPMLQRPNGRHHHHNQHQHHYNDYKNVNRSQWQHWNM